MLWLATNSFEPTELIGLDVVAGLALSFIGIRPPSATDKPFSQQFVVLSLYA